MDFKITNITAIVDVDPNDGDEGLWAFISDGTWIPMIFADEVKFNACLPVAEMMKKEYGRQFRVLQFSQREDITERLQQEGKISK